MIGSEHLQNSRTLGFFQYAVASIYQKWSNEEPQSHGQPGLIDIGGLSGPISQKSYCSKNTKKFMLTMIDRFRTHGTSQLVARGTLWLPKAPTVVTGKSELGHGAIEEGSLVCWIIFSLKSCGQSCVCTTYLREEGKPTEALWISGHSSARKPKVLPFMCMLPWHVPPT